MNFPPWSVYEISEDPQSRSFNISGFQILKIIIKITFLIPVYSVLCSVFSVLLHIFWWIKCNENTIICLQSIKDLFHKYCNLRKPFLLSCFGLKQATTIKLIQRTMVSISLSRIPLYFQFLLVAARHQTKAITFRAPSS